MASKRWYVRESGGGMLGPKEWGPYDSKSAAQSERRERIERYVEYALPGGRRAALQKFRVVSRRQNPGGHAAKMRRCIRKVKRRGGVRDAAAVCARSIMQRRNALRYRALQQADGTYHIIDSETGERVRTAKTRSAALQIVTSLNAKAAARARRGNPDSAEAARALSEAWTGKAADGRTRTVTEKVRYTKNLTPLAGLVCLEILEPPQDLLFDRRSVKLASSPNGRQLHIVGGDQSVDLRKWPVDSGKERITLGKVRAIVYWGAKWHLSEEDKTPGQYRHRFGEEGGQMPDLIYDRLNRSLEFSGGDYYITRDMKGGRFSAGIRN